MRAQERGRANTFSGAGKFYVFQNSVDKAIGDKMHSKFCKLLSEIFPWLAQTTGQKAATLGELSQNCSHNPLYKAFCHLVSIPLSYPVCR